MKFDDENIFCIMGLHTTEYYTTCIFVYDSHVYDYSCYMYMFTYIILLPAILHRLRGGNLLDLSGTENLFKIKIRYNNSKRKAYCREDNNICTVYIIIYIHCIPYVLVLYAYIYNALLCC